MKNNSVSIYLPSVSADFARQSLLSLLSQTYRNFEILLSDNSSEGCVVNSDEISELVSQNPKINLMNSFPQTKGDLKSHHQLLLEMGNGDFFKFMFDDDLLSPLSIEHLVGLCVNENVVAAFHARYNFSDPNFVISIPNGLDFTGGVYRKLNYYEVSDLIFSYCINIFSEPSFAIYRTDAKFIFKNSANLEGLNIRYLGDVLAPLLVCRRFGSVVISGAKFGFFRKHNRQDSSMDSPVRLSGLVEWELISRYLNQEHKFSHDKIIKNKNRISEIYAREGGKFPFLLDRVEYILNGDEEYIVDERFKDFYRECGKLQGID